MEGMGKHLMVASLVFGTTQSCYAFSTIQEFEENPLHINFNAPWRIEYHIGMSDTTSTCLLLDKEKQFEAFGYDATNRYYELVINQEHANYYFFDHFTMSLHNNENVTRDMVLKDKTGKQCSAVEVFTLSIKALVNRLTESFVNGKCLHHQVLWVLTVPSASTDSAKQLMKESAEKAGINTEQLLLVSEPEAAFTYCHYFPTTTLQGSKPGIMNKEPGTKSMVVDLGDMTADITVLQQTYNGQLKVLCRATGDDCGGTSVDDRFCNMLEEICGGNVIAEWKRQDPREWIDMLRTFRRAIEKITTSNTNVIRLRFPFSLNEICEELHGKDLNSVIKSSSYVTEITQFNAQLRIKADLMIMLGTPTIDSIITLMKKTFSNSSTNGVSNDISNILMVGGLSKCPMLQDAVYKAFPDNQIIIPKETGFSVLCGAVLFGHRPDYIWSELRDEEGIGK